MRGAELSVGCMIRSDDPLRTEFGCCAHFNLACPVRVHMYFVSSLVFDLTFFCQLKQEQQRKELEEADVLEEGWEYVEDGPAEITWIGNEIIVKKARRKVRKGIETGTPDLEVILNNICQFLLVLFVKHMHNLAVSIGCPWYYQGY